MDLIISVPKLYRHVVDFYFFMWKFDRMNWGFNRDLSFDRITY